MLQSMGSQKVRHNLAKEQEPLQEPWADRGLVCASLHPPTNTCRPFPPLKGELREEAWVGKGLGLAAKCARLGEQQFGVLKSTGSIWNYLVKVKPGKSHGWRSLVGCSPWGLEELDMTERLHFDFSLSCTGEGNGNPLQCSCLENPRDRRARWVSVYGVAQSRTRLTRLSSSSESKRKKVLVA